MKYKESINKYVGGIKYLLPSVFLLLAVGCTYKSGKNQLYGSWITEGYGKKAQKIKGFTLGRNGLASTINNPRFHYETWKRDGNLLIICGKEIKDTCFLPLIDTFYIKEVTEKNLVIVNSGNEIKCIKEQ